MGVLRRTRVGLLTVWALVYGLTLGTPPLMDDADSVHAEVAREMLVRHDYVTLYANGIRYLEKAPLYYWSMAASMKLFGVGTWQSRVPLAVAMLALALLAEAFARRVAVAYGVASADRAGLYAGLGVLLSFGMFVFGRINLPDVMVCVWLGLAMFCFWLSEDEARPRRALCWGFAAACALDVLTKGLIGIVFPVGIVGVSLLLTRGWRGTWRRVGELRVWSSLLVFLVIAVPWHVLAGLANPGHGVPGDLHRVDGHWEVPLPTDGNVHGWTWFYFVNEQVYRYLNVRVPHDYDTAPLWLFWGLVLVWIMPWSAFVPGAVRAAFRAGWVRRLRRLDAGEKAGLLLVAWAVLPPLFFSFSTRQEYYVLPSLLPLLVLVGVWLARAPVPGRTHRGEAAMNGTLAATRDRSDGVSVALAAVGGLVALGCGWFLLHTRAPAAGTDLASLLATNPGDYALSMGHFLDLNAEALGLFRGPLLLTAVAVLGGTMGHLLLRRAGRPHGAVLALAAGSLGFLGAVHWGRVIFSPVLSSYELAREVAARVRPGDMVAIYGEYEAGSTLGFYLRRNDLHLVEGRSSNLWYGSFFPDVPRIFETRATMERKWTGPQRIFLWVDPGDRERPAMHLDGTVYAVGRSGGKLVISNQADRR